MSEKIIGFLQVMQQGIDKIYLLCFTSSRVIVTKKDIPQFESTAAVLLLGQVAAAIAAYNEKKNKAKNNQFLQLSPEDILKADNKNFSIAYSDIMKVEMKKPGRIWAPEINITTNNNRTLRFYMSREYMNRELFDACFSLVHSVLPDKLSVKK